MSDINIRKLVRENALELLETKLVARTWGNISAKQDDDTIVITPSFMAYKDLKDEDLVAMNIVSGEWSGLHKPSSENGIHLSAFRTFQEVGYVIHTHQIYATAVGLAGYENLDITQEERKLLGGLALAKYGLPGSAELTAHVTRAYESGAHTVLMAHHGVVICAADKEEAMKRALLLEEICRRQVERVVGTVSEKEPAKGLAKINDQISQTYTITGFSKDPYILEYALQNPNSCLKCQLDDMAQMIGNHIAVVDFDKADIIQSLAKADVVMAPGGGAFVTARSKGDVEALLLLTQKAALCALYSQKLGVKATISHGDCITMRKMYLKNA